MIGTRTMIHGTVYIRTVLYSVKVLVLSQSGTVAVLQSSAHVVPIQYTVLYSACLHLQCILHTHTNTIWLPLLWKPSFHDRVFFLLPSILCIIIIIYTLYDKKITRFVLKLVIGMFIC